VTWKDHPQLPTWRPYGWTSPRLTVQQREEIKQRYADGETAVALALEFGVSGATVRNVVSAR